MANIKKKMRCIQCGEYHQGECNPIYRVAFVLDCFLDSLDEYLDFPAEQGSRRDLIARGEYPAKAKP